MPTLLEQEKKAKQPTVQINKNTFFIFLNFDLINKGVERKRVRKSKGRMRGQHSKAMVSRKHSQKNMIFFNIFLLEIGQG